MRNIQNKTPFECGFTPKKVFGQLFIVKFLFVGVLFIIFDLELVLLYPVFMYRYVREGALELCFVFVGLIFVLFFKEWQIGKLE